MTDKKLLELAAKAAGHTLKWGEVFIVGGDEIDCTDMSYVVSGQPDEADWHWNPLTDDGDALKLAVKLNIDIFGDDEYRRAEIDNWNCAESANDDKYAATRRAIVSAAAEIGKALQ